MLDADYLERVTKDMEKVVGQMNDYLIEKIAKRIDALFRLSGEVKLIPSSIYDVRKAEQAGMLLEDIAAEVQKRLPHIEAEVKAAFLDAADKISIDTAERTREVIEVEHEIGNLTDISLDEVTPFEAVGLPRDAENLDLTPKEIRLLESAYRQSKHDVKNFTRTMPNHGQDLYIRLCDEAYMKVRHGVSLDTAICEAIDGAAKQGISTVSYGGRTERAEVAIARAVRTGVNRASGDIVLCRCAEMGVNHVLVSQHLGARVTGTNDFRDHSQWQGKVYKLDWNKPALAKYQPTAAEEKENDRRFSFLAKIKNFLKRTFEKDYPDFIDNCGYGEMLGICGINCRHTFTQFYPKINKNIQKPYDSEENRKKYETEQHQRAMERAIRKSITKIKATEAVTQTTEMANELRRLQKLLDRQTEAYDKYCTDNHLSKQNYRIKVAGFKRAQAAKANGRATAHSNSVKVPMEKAKSTGYTKRTEEEFEQVARQIRDEIKQYSDRPSKWSGKILVYDTPLIDNEAIGRKEWSCDISVVNTADDGVIWHEMLHSCSVSHYDENVYFQNEAIEEASVEFLKQQICKEMEITSADSYVDQVPILQMINAKFEYGTDMDFARALFNVPLPERYQWLEDKVDASLRSVGASFSDYNDVMLFLEGLKGVIR